MSDEQPQLYSIERSGDTKTRDDHVERKLDPIDKSGLDKNNELGEAQKALVGNTGLYQKFFQAVSDKEVGDAAAFAYIENLFITHCQNLSDSEIDSLVRQFNKGLNEYASKQAGILSHKHSRPENIKRKEINSRGIVSVINFIRARKQLLDLDPAHTYRFYVETNLDARYQIDLIECLFEKGEGELRIDSMNLIQVKSSQPEEEDIEKIVNSHRRWANSDIMDFASFEREYTDGIPDEVTIEMLARNADDIETVLMDMYTDPNGFNPDEFINRLDLEDLNNKQKAWLLSQYSGLIKKRVLENRDRGNISGDQANSIVEAVDKLESKVRAKAKLPRNITRIRNINSIIAVGPTIVHEEPLVTRASDPGTNTTTDRIMKYN